MIDADKSKIELQTCLEWQNFFDHNNNSSCLDTIWDGGIKFPIECFVQEYNVRPILQCDQMARLLAQYMAF